MVNDPVVTAPVELPVTVTSLALSTMILLIAVPLIMITQEPLGSIVVWDCAGAALDECGGAVPVGTVVMLAVG